MTVISRHCRKVWLKSPIPKPWKHHSPNTMIRKGISIITQPWKFWKMLWHRLMQVSFLPPTRLSKRRMKGQDMSWTKPSNCLTKVSSWLPTRKAPRKPRVTVRLSCRCLFSRANLVNQINNGLKRNPGMCAKAYFAGSAVGVPLNHGCWQLFFQVA